MAKGDIISRLKLESGEFDSKIKRAGQELLNYAEHCKKMGIEMGYANKDARDFAAALGNMATVSTTARGKINELSEAFVNAKVMYKNMTDEEKKGQFGKNLAASLDQLKTRINDAKKDLADVQNELAGSGNKFGQFGNVIDTLGSKLGIAGNLTELLTSQTALLTGAVGAGIAIVTKATEAWASYNAELAKQDQITTVTTGLKDDDADRMTDKMRALSETYNVDFREAVNAANVLMAQFGESGDNAITIIKDGMQGMIQGDGPKLLSMIQQYAPAFRDAGVSASQLVAVIQNSEGGIFTDQNMNAIVFGIKNIRLMTKQTSDALSKLGIDGEKMSQQLSNGTMTVFDALRQVAGQLKNVDSNSKAAGEVMQAVFGRQGAMAGTNLAKAIESLNTNLQETRTQTGKVGESFAELQEANERLNKAIRDCFEYDGWDVMANSIKTNLIDALVQTLKGIEAIEKAWTSTTGQTIFDGIVDGALNTLGPLGQVISFLKDIKQLVTGNGGGSNPSNGYGDMQRVMDYIKNGNTQAEREKRYERQLADLNKKLERVGQERRIENGNGSVSYQIDKPEVQQQKREALLRRRTMLIMNRDAIVENGGPAFTPQIPTTEKHNNNINKPTPKPLKHKDDTNYAADSIMAQEKEVAKLTDQWKRASAELKDGYKRQLDEAKAKLVEMQQEKVELPIGSLPQLTQQLQDLQKEQQKSLNNDEWRKYQQQIDETTEKINILKGVLPKESQAVFTLDVNADQLEQMRMFLETDDKTIRVNVEEGEINLPDVPTDDKTIRVNIIADTADAMQEVRDFIGNVGGTEIHIVPKVDEPKIPEAPTMTEGEQLVQSIRTKVSDDAIASDMKTLHSLLETQIKNNIEGIEIPVDKILADIQGEGIPDEYWENLQAQINEKLAEMHVDPIEIDFSTGNIKKQSKEMEKDWHAAASAIQSVGSAMAQIEDPATKVIGTVAQAIASVALAASQAMAAKDTTASGWAWIGAAAAITGTMISTIAAIHSATGYAQGGIVDGSGGGFVGGMAYSGDQIGNVRLDSGELVLNRAQQNNLASQLEGNPMQNLRLSATISGEQIKLALNNNGRRTGKGEYVQTNFR